MKNIFGYIRVSGKAQADKDGPVRQQVAIEKFVASLGRVDRFQIFEDLGVSGTIEGVDRPGFVDMLVAAQPGDIVIVENLDRLARDLVVQELIIRELKDREIALYATDQGDRNLVEQSACEDPSRTLIRQIFGAIAQFAKSSLVIKLRVARERKRKLTGRCEGAPAYGKTRGELVLMKLVVTLKDSGIGYRGIAALLNQQGVKKRTGLKPWTASEAENLYKKAIKYGPTLHTNSGQPTA